MANQTNSLAHTKWLCKYHIVFCPKHRRKITYNQYQADLREIIRTLCKYKGVEIIEGNMMYRRWDSMRERSRSISKIRRSMI